MSSGGGNDYGADLIIHEVKVIHVKLWLFRFEMSVQRLFQRMPQPIIIEKDDGKSAYKIDYLKKKDINKKNFNVYPSMFVYIQWKNS